MILNGLSMISWSCACAPPAPPPPPPPPPPLKVANNIRPCSKLGRTFLSGGRREVGMISHKPRRCASRNSTNQNRSFVEWFSRLERAVFRGIWSEIFTLFQACVGNFDTIPPWKAVGTLYLDSSSVNFKYFAFLSVCDKFELLLRVQDAMMIWVLFSLFFLDPLLITVSGFIGLFW